jgi:acyl-CoA synthetase (AMP-forming)/AMP-acid ligase II
MLVFEDKKIYYKETHNMTFNTISAKQFVKHSVLLFPHIGKGIRAIKTLILSKPEKNNSIGLVFEKLVAKQPNHPAVCFDNKTLSYDQLNKKVNQYAHYFTEQGVGNGDVVAIFIDNRVESLIACLAAVKLGAVAGMLNTAQRNDVLLHSIKLISPKIMIVGEELLPAVENVKGKWPEGLIDSLLYVEDTGSVPCPKDYYNLDELSALCSNVNPYITKAIKAKQACYYIFTSGTTGMPKASVMTHMRWLKAGGFLTISSRLNKDDVIYLSLPLYHNNAITVTLSSVLFAGATIAFCRKFSASGFWDDIRRYKATGFCYIGELCRYLLNQPIKKNDGDNPVRLVIGNGLRPEIWDEFQERYDIPQITEFYASSEGNVAFFNMFNFKKTAGFCPLFFSVVKYDANKDSPFRNKNGFMECVKKGESGLLVTKIGKLAPFDGYTDKSETEKKILRGVHKKGDRYFHTGDLVTRQGFGHVAFVDRLGDTFRWKGENVATTQIEGVATEHEHVDHCVAYGIEIPNTEGRAGMAALTLNRPIEEFDIQAFSELLRDKLPHYAVPLFVRIKSAQEITGTFKYKKIELKNESYSLEQVKDSIFVMRPKNNYYEILTEKLEDEINQGVCRF